MAYEDLPVNDIRLTKELEDRISPFVPNPNLFVMVLQPNSMLIYVIGKVNNPGRFVLNTNVNVLQALAMAGGLNPFAKRNNIRIFRKTRGKNRIFNFAYDHVTEGRDRRMRQVARREHNRGGRRR